MSLQEDAYSITEFELALAELAIVLVESANLRLHTVCIDQTQAYITRLATILEELAPEPNAADVLSNLKELRADMGDVLRSLHWRGLH